MAMCDLEQIGSGGQPIEGRQPLREIGGLDPAGLRDILGAAGVERPERRAENATAAFAPKPWRWRDMTKSVVEQHFAHVRIRARIDAEHADRPVPAAAQRIRKDMAIGSDTGTVGEREIVAVDADVELGHHGFAITAA